MLQALRLGQFFRSHPASPWDEAAERSQWGYEPHMVPWEEGRRPSPTSHSFHGFCPDPVTLLIPPLPPPTPSPGILLSSLARDSPGLFPILRGTCKLSLGTQGHLPPAPCPPFQPWALYSTIPSSHSNCTTLLAILQVQLAVSCLPLCLCICCSLPGMPFSPWPVS